MLEVPGHDKHSLSRTNFDVPVVIPHEIVDRAVAKHPEIMEELQHKHDLRLLPPSNKVLFESFGENHRHRCFLFRFTWMLHPYSMTDSCLAVWLEELATGRRFVIAILRKRRVCKCGCRGWCSYWVLMNWLRTCFVALGKGKWPMQRHDCNTLAPKINSEQSKRAMNC